MEVCINNITYINIPTECPICKQKLIISTSESGTKTLKCINKNCNGVLLNKINHYFSNKGLNAKGISKATIEKLISWGWVFSIQDMYNLKSKMLEWFKQPGFGEKSVVKIINSIEESTKNVDLINFISALGIDGVGKTIAKEIVKYYSTWEDFRNAIGGDWTEFEGFGPEISNAINKFDYSEFDDIAGWLTFKQPEVQVEKESSAAIKDKKFCATGKLQNFTRDSLKADIEAHGGKMVSSISSKVDYLITNTPDSGTAKIKKAQELGIKIITEEQYLQIR